MRPFLIALIMTLGACSMPQIQSALCNATEVKVEKELNLVDTQT